MGTIDKGILGGFNGKVGTVIGTSWKGITVMRSKSGKRKKPSSPSQLEQQARFSLVVDFLQPLTDMLNEAFQGVGMSGYNKALSYNIQYAIAGVYPDFTIDFSKVYLSRGRVPEPQSAALSSPTAGKLSYTWADNSGVKGAKATDQLVVAVYCEAMKQWVHIENAAPRNAGTCTVDVTAFSGKPVQTWISFVSDTGKFATSLSTGLVNVL